MRPPVWPFTSFRARNEYAFLPDADLTGLPRELNPYERFWVRFVLADLKVLLIFAVAAPLCLLVWAAESSRWVALVSLPVPVAIGVMIGLRHRR